MCYDNLVGPMGQNSAAYKTRYVVFMSAVARHIVGYRITEMFLFFCIFGDRNGDTIVGIK